MTPTRWQRTEELFHVVRALPAGERAAFLAQACGDDEALRLEVESLLNEPASGDGLLDRPPRVDAAVLPPPAKLGHTLAGYHLQALLGAGGMGEVYRAHDPSLGRDVAIKILPSAFTKDPDRLARFEREARMLAALNHPNICGIHGIEEADGIRLLVLELVEGETLADRLADVSRRSSRGSGLALPDALAIARQIADALEVAHDKGMVHRDLKPANISITANGVVKVLDFGLAKTVGGGSSPSDLTRAPGVTHSEGRVAGAVIGTAAYMSPEQARGLPIDKRTDIWAFGCVLYEMLTGRVTFAGDTVSDSIAKLLERDPDWAALPPTTPASIRRLLVRCLTKDAKRRLRDIGDVRIEIDAIDEALPDASEARTAPPRRWPLALALGVVMLSVGGAAASWLTRSPSSPLSIESRFANATFTPFTNFDGAELDAAISRDGRFVAFMADHGGPFHAWLKQVGSGGFVDLTPGQDDQRNRGPTGSVGFSGDESEVWINGTGGRRMALVPLMGGTSHPFLTERAINVAWSPLGTELVYFTFDDGDPVFVADRTGGNARQLFADKPGDHNHFTVWSPDGQWIYYAHGIQAVSEFDIWRIRPTGGPRERLTNLKTDVRFLTPIDARTVLFVAPEQDGSGPWLWALDVERRVTRRLSSGLERYLSVGATADGQRLVASVSKSSATLWSAPILDRLADDRDVKPYPMPTGRALAPRFGKGSLFYLSSNGPGDGLWRDQDDKAVEIWRGADQPLTEPVAVSPNGDRLAVVFRNQGKLSLALTSVDGADRQTLADSIDVRGTCAWSPDGRWIAAGATDAQGAGLFMIPIDGSAPVRLVKGAAVDPVWSPDGTVIVYAGQQTAKAPLRAVRPADRTPVTLPEIWVPGGGGGRSRFLPNGELVYMEHAPAGKQNFWLLDLNSGQSRQLTKLSDPATTSAFDITPDGSHIVFDRLREHSDVRLIDLPR